MIVEGILIFADPRLLEQLDIKVFVDTPDDIRFIRRLRRDIAERGRTVESVIEQYMARCGQCICSLSSRQNVTLTSSFRKVVIIW